MTKVYALYYNPLMRILIAIITILFSIPFFSLTIQAEDVIWCLPGTGTDAVACQPCIPGPYNICVPDTGIFDFIFSPAHDTSAASNLALILVILSTILIANYFLIRKYLTVRK